MRVDLQEKNDVLIFKIDGDIDINTSPEVKKSFDKSISEKKAKILVDLKDVSYVDSSGLATLVEILKNMRAYGGKFKLINLSDKVKSLFEITKLDKLFDIQADEESAINSF